MCPCRKAMWLETVFSADLLQASAGYLAGTTGLGGVQRFAWALVIGEYYGLASVGNDPCQLQREAPANRAH